MKSEKKWFRQSCLQSRNRDTDVENKRMRGEGRGWDKLRYWDSHIHTIATTYKVDN